MGVAILEIYNNNEYFKYLSFNTLWVVMMLYGSVASLYYVINALDMLLDLFIRDPVPLEKFGAGKGFWAGKEMALQLADKGFNIIMLSRTPSKLNEVQKIIVNNVGLCHENPIFFDEESEKLCNDMVEVNVNTMMNVTRIVVPQMQKRKNGLIINMGSFAALRSLPFLSVYAGTKGFILVITFTSLDRSVKKEDD
ncbi:hypothetical protein IWW45_003753 [Coemansia sp. RSA 485]|nr:hypothetical protein IWW45_003753 [Coemansia sp. RSA 485]